MSRSRGVAFGAYHDRARRPLVAELSPLREQPRGLLDETIWPEFPRELERLAALDLRGMWILGGWCPDHRTIGRFVAKLHGKISQTRFEHLTVEALRAVGKRVCDVSLDGTVIAAVASRSHRLGVEAPWRPRVSPAPARGPWAFCRATASALFGP